MQKWKVKCPLKVIILGEHAVLYKKRALMMAVDLYLTLEITHNTTTQITFNGKQFYDGTIVCKETPSLMISFLNCAEGENRVVAGILHLLNTLAINCHINIESEIPLGCGLGTSAAASISVALGCLTLANEKYALKLSEEEVKQRSYTISHDLDNFIHGKGSGIDVATCFYGGIQYYNGLQCLDGLFSEYCKPIDLVLPQIHIVYSKVSKNTIQMVEKVTQQYKFYPEVVLSIMNTINELINLALKDSADWIAICNYCHSMLVALGVSHPKIDYGINLIKSDEIGCKLTGAGNGGCFIVFGPLSTSKISLLKDNDFEVFEAKLSKGVEIKPFT